MEQTTGQAAYDAESFQSHRRLLFAIAYRMLGSASEAEDVLQDAYLRYQAAPRNEIRALRPYLTTVVTRLCLDRLKAARAAREQYLGPWLPEPILTAAGAADPEDAAERHESITLAFLVLLEALTPQERAVFLLREVFEYRYAEVAAALQLSEANCRQIFRRAKARIAEGGPRFTPAPGRQRELVARFLAATERGEVTALEQLLAHDVSIWSDGGGKVTALPRPVRGRDPVLKIVLGFTRRAERLTGVPSSELRVTLDDVNGAPTILAWAGARLDTLIGLSIAGERVGAIWVIRNPEKLAYVERQLRPREGQG